MSAADEFDAIIIGAGPAGEATAAKVAGSGLTVALIERELVGGECPYWGCMPSKALLRAAQARDEARRNPGVICDEKLDIAAVLHRRDEVTRNLDDSSHALRMERRQEITLLRGNATLSGVKQVEVALLDGASRTIRARTAVVICTGSSAAVPPVPGLRESAPWTNREGTLATSVPKSLIVIGGGPIGVELAQAWSSLGSTVHIVEGAPRLLVREEEFASEAVRTALTAEGIGIHLGVKAELVHRDDMGYSVTLDDGSKLQSEELIVAAGRHPNTRDLGLELAGIETDERGYLRTDDALRVNGSDWLYAVGDVTGRSAFTHTAAYHAQIAGARIAGENCTCVEDLIAAPRVTFCEPQVAAVGHTEESARAAGLDVEIVDRDLSRLAASSFHGRGVTSTARAIFDRKSTNLIGATIIGADVADLIHPASVAILGAIPLERLRHAVAPFPTRSEIWTALAREAESRLVSCTT